MSRAQVIAVLMIALSLLLWSLLREQQPTPGTVSPSSTPSVTSHSEESSIVGYDAAEVIRNQASTDPGEGIYDERTREESAAFVSGQVEVHPSSWSEPLVLRVTIGNSEEDTNWPCSEGGAFRIPIPTPSSSVVIRVPNWFRITSIEGCERINEAIVIVAGARADVRLEVELLPFVTFQLNWEEGGEPLAFQEALMRIDWLTGGSMAASFVTDETGAARIGMPYLENLAKVWVTVWNLPGGSRFTRAFEGDILRTNPGPHLIAVRIGDPVKFFAHGPDGRAIEGARADLGGEASLSSSFDGIGQYRDAIPHEDRVTFRAPGHRSAQVLVPHPAPALLDVAMERASTLSVQLVNVVPEARDAYRLRVRFLRLDGGSVLTESDHDYGSVRRGSLRVGSTMRKDPEYSHELWLEFDEEGMLQLDGIRTDRSAQVELIVAGVTLRREFVQFTADGVERALTLDASFEARSVRGRVVGDDLVPLAGAQVWIGDASATGTSSGTYTQTDAEGNFLAMGVPAGADLKVWCEVDGRVRAEVLVRGSSSAAELLLACPRLRQVEVRVFGPDGRPYSTGGGERVKEGPRAVLESGKTLYPDDGAEAHSWLFAFPPGIVTLRITTPDGSCEIKHDTAHPEASLFLRP